MQRRREMQQAAMQRRREGQPPPPAAKTPKCSSLLTSPGVPKPRGAKLNEQTPAISKSAAVLEGGGNLASEGEGNDHYLDSHHDKVTHPAVEMQPHSVYPVSEEKSSFCEVEALSGSLEGEDGKILVWVESSAACGTNTESQIVSAARNMVTHHEQVKLHFSPVSFLTRSSPS